MFTHTHSHTHTHTHTRAHTHTHTHTRTHKHTHTHTLKHTHASTHKRAHTHTHACTHAHGRTHTHIHTRAHARTHTHTHPLNKLKVDTKTVTTGHQETSDRSSILFYTDIRKVNQCIPDRWLDQSPDPALRPAVSAINLLSALSPWSLHRSHLACWFTARTAGCVHTTGKADHFAANNLYLGLKYKSRIV